MPAYDSRTALIVVDVQNDFADPDGSLSVRGADTVIAACNREIAAALSAGATIVYTQDWHPQHTPHFEPDGGIWPVHCVADSWGAQLHPGLRSDAGLVVRKGVDGEDGYSGFSRRDPLSGEPSSTELESLLRERGLTHIVVAGLATDYCVRSTAADAVDLGFAVSVVADTVAAVNLEPGDGDAALTALAAAGVAIERGGGA